MTYDAHAQKMWDEISEKYAPQITDSERELSLEVIGIIENSYQSKNIRLLNAGAGNGHLSALLAMNGFYTDLLDFSKSALSKAKGCYDQYDLCGNFYYADLLDTEIINALPKDYDIVWNCEVFEHYNEEELGIMLSNLLSLKAKHYLFIIPNARSLPYRLFRQKADTKRQWVSGKENVYENFAAILERHGLKSPETYYLGRSAAQEHMRYVMEVERGIPLADMQIPGFENAEPAYLAAYCTAETQSFFFGGSGNPDESARLFGLFESLSRYKQEIKAEIEKHSDSNRVNAQIISDKVRELGEKDHVVNELERSLNVSELVIANKSRMLEEKDNILNDLVRQLNEKSNTIHDMAQMLDEKERIIVEQEDMLKKKDRTVGETELLLKEKDQCIEDKDTYIEALENACIGELESICGVFHEQTNTLLTRIYSNYHNSCDIAGIVKTARELSEETMQVFSTRNLRRFFRLYSFFGLYKKAAFRRKFYIIASILIRPLRKNITLVNPLCDFDSRMQVLAAELSRIEEKATIIHEDMPTDLLPQPSLTVMLPGTEMKQEC